MISYPKASRSETKKCYFVRNLCIFITCVVFYFYFLYAILCFTFYENINVLLMKFILMKIFVFFKYAYCNNTMLRFKMLWKLSLIHGILKHKILKYSIPIFRM